MSAAELPLEEITLFDAVIPELPGPYHGKVRDCYDLPDGRRVIIASDRLSAFDRILCEAPWKGQVLTQTARFWFEETADICPNHVLSYPDPNVLISKRLSMLPVEMVVRGYLAGTTSTSILTQYQTGRRTLYGVTLPDGLAPNQKLERPLITPTSKAEAGAHDEPLSPDDVLAQKLVTPDQWEVLSAYALALFARGQKLASERGLILADTKYEFGVDEAGVIHIADEIHTPDSSRYWLADTYKERLAAGKRPDSFDKDFVRSWVAERCDPYVDDIPVIPESLIRRTSEVYIDAYQRITTRAFEKPDPSERPLARIRRNLADLLSG